MLPSLLQLGLPRGPFERYLNSRCTICTIVGSSLGGFFFNHENAGTDRPIAAVNR